MTWQQSLYDSMLADVLSLTNRPDLDAESAIALRAATTNAHLTDAYFRDFAVTQVQLPNSSNQLGLNIPTLFGLTRGFSSIRPIDQSYNLLTPGQDQLIEIVEIGDIYDSEYGNLRTNIAYASGSNLVIRCPIQCWGYAVEWLKAPQTRRDLYDSWIAQSAPAIIIYWAAALVFNTNGNEEKAKSYLTQIEKFYIPQLKQNYLQTAVR